MRTLIRLQRTFQRGQVHGNLAAAVHLCCHRLVPAARAGLRRRGALGEVAVEVTASALAACRRTPRK
ncbi:hypothetical protein [Saccharopolyspora shandongensis]|uniref:hypothetical protein n=1 Tax=Saccharopolyspora shandongensis TaxID=418495 RepID=UPI0034100610